MASEYDFHELFTSSDLAKASAFLQGYGLRLPEEVSYGVGAYHGETLIATGFFGAGKLMGLCVDDAWRGEGLSVAIVDHLIKEALDRNCDHLFLFTKASEAASFAGAGFDLLVQTSGDRGGSETPVALLEWGTRRIDDWLRAVRTETGWKPSPDERIGAVVVNANPFTRGHLYLIEQAAACCEHVFVFVVCEDVSEFSFAVRLELVRQGVAHLPQCRVLSGEKYIISRQTFPSYFTGEEGKAAAHAALDAALFASRIAGDLGISVRFVGTEPLSPVTAMYNTALRETLPLYGVELREIPRLEEHGMPVSASRVRALLAAGDSEGACALTPPCTARFLRSSVNMKVCSESEE